MAATNASPFERTPGAPAPDEIADTPLTVGPPDALIESQRTEYDYVPDLETKGFHTGMVRQPAEIIGTPENVRGFEATGSAGPSKFDNGTDLRSLKAHANERENSDPRYAGVLHRPMASDDELRAQQAYADAHRPIGGALPDENGDDGDTVASLRERAKAAGLTGYSGLSKADLKVAVEEAEGTTTREIKASDAGTAGD